MLITIRIKEMTKTLECQDKNNRGVTFQTDLAQAKLINNSQIEIGLTTIIKIINKKKLSNNSNKNINSLRISTKR